MDYFIKEIGNIFFLYKHWRFGRRTRNSVETLALLARVPTAISRSPKLPLCFCTGWKPRKFFHYFLNFTYIFQIFVLVISYREATKSSIGGCD